MNNIIKPSFAVANLGLIMGGCWGIMIGLLSGFDTGVNFVYILRGLLVGALLGFLTCFILSIAFILLMKSLDWKFSWIFGVFFGGIAGAISNMLTVFVSIFQLAASSHTSLERQFQKLDWGIIIIPGIVFGLSAAIALTSRYGKSIDKINWIPFLLK